MRERKSERWLLGVGAMHQQRRRVGGAGEKEKEKENNGGGDRGHSCG